MGTKVPKGMILFMQCDTEGAYSDSIAIKGCRNECCDEMFRNGKMGGHYFVILSHDEYNGWNTHYLALALSSTKGKFAIQLTPDGLKDYAKLQSEIPNAFLEHLKSSYVLTDKICKVHSRYVRNSKSPYVKLQEPFLQSLIGEVMRFIKTPDGTPV